MLRKSDLIKPSVPLWLTLDHPFDWLSRSTTLVFLSSVLIMLLLVEGPALRFTPVEVQRLELCDASAPSCERRSDLIKPVEPLCLTLDHPFDWFSNTSTLVRADNVLIMSASVDALDLRFTLPLVLRVDIAASVDAVAARSLSRLRRFLRVLRNLI